MNIIDFLLSFIAPYDCLVCGCEGQLLCGWCRQDALLPLPPACYRCGRAESFNIICGGCASTTALADVWVATGYEAAAKQLVKRLKFDRAQSAASIIALTMSETLPYLRPETIVTHIPTANVRVRQRGYDQAQLIARQLAHLRGLSYQRLLTRQGKSRQVGASRLERQRNLHDAFVLRRPYNLQGTPVVIVDDVLTTGATIEAAAHVLAKTGSPDVSAALFAYKLPKN